MLRLLAALVSLPRQRWPKDRHFLKPVKNHVAITIIAPTGPMIALLLRPIVACKIRTITVTAIIATTTQIRTLIHVFMSTPVLHADWKSGMA
jgi:hypothetical protein